MNNEIDLAEKLNKIIKNYDYFLNKTFLAKTKLKRFTKKNIKKYESLFDRI